MDYKAEIVDIATNILEDRMSVIEGSHELARFQFGYDLQDNKNLLFFVGIASETEYLPVGKEREQWNHKVLAKKDVEIRKIENYYMKDAKVACEELIKLFQSY